MPTKSKSTIPRKSRTSGKKVKATKVAATPELTPEPVVVAPGEPTAVETVAVESAPVETVAVESAPVETVAVESAPVESQELSIDDQFKDIITRLQQFRTLSQSLMADVRKLQKNVNRRVRESAKKQRKRKTNSDVKRPPSGFAKPTLISDSLCQFLGVEAGTHMARTEVTKHLTKYIKAHELQDEANKRIINCDSALAGLLKVQPSDEVTYFNLQRYMKPHFPQSAANLAAAAAALALNSAS